MNESSPESDCGAYLCPFLLKIPNWCGHIIPILLPFLGTVGGVRGMAQITDYMSNGSYFFRPFANCSILEEESRFKKKIILFFKIK